MTQHDFPNKYTCERCKGTGYEPEAVPADQGQADGFDETYYTKGKDATWFANLTDKDFAWEATKAAMDLNDTAILGDAEKWMPIGAIIADAGDRIKRLTSYTAGQARVEVKPLNKTEREHGYIIWGLKEQEEPYFWYTFDPHYKRVHFSGCHFLGDASNPEEAENLVQKHYAGMCKAAVRSMIVGT